MLFLECSGCNIELAFLLDASSKAGNDWANIRNFVHNIVTRFNINPNCVRVAVILYADNAQVPIPLNRYNDVNSLRQGINSLNIIGGGSNLATALQVLRTQVFPINVVRSGARLIALIVTDRLQTCSSQIITEANSVKSMGVFVVGVGITQNRLVDSSCMRRIVSCNYIEVPFYNQLNNQITQTVRYICAATCASTYRLLTSRVCINSV